VPSVRASPTAGKPDRLGFSPPMELDAKKNGGSVREPRSRLLIA
jgi:hypothetical protein